MNYITEGFVKAIELIVTLNPEVIEITTRSLMISISATAIAAIICIPLGAVISFNEFPGKSAIINLVQTLYALPTVLVGLLLYMLISRAGPLGSFGFLFNPSGMIIGQTILISPIITGLTISALSGVDATIRDTVMSLGATQLQFFVTILKEARFALLSGIAMGFGRAISEVGVAIMIGGNIRGFTRVLTTSISLETSMGNISFSLALGMILLAIALIVNSVVTRFQQQDR